jgi:hypothetical protein
MTKIRVGTCSWADESLVKNWYPRELVHAHDLVTARLSHGAGGRSLEGRNPWSVYAP